MSRKPKTLNTQPTARKIEVKTTTESEVPFKPKLRTQAEQDARLVTGPLDWIKYARGRAEWSAVSDIVDMWDALVALNRYMGGARHVVFLESIESGSTLWARFGSDFAESTSLDYYLGERFIKCAEFTIAYDFRRINLDQIRAWLAVSEDEFGKAFHRCYQTLKPILEYDGREKYLPADKIEELFNSITPKSPEAEELAEALCKLPWVDCDECERWGRMNALRDRVLGWRRGGSMAVDTLIDETLKARRENTITLAEAITKLDEGLKKIGWRGYGDAAATGE
jgi:hypothetical protein